MNKKRMEIINNRADEILLTIRLMNDNQDAFSKEDFNKTGEMLAFMELLGIIEIKDHGTKFEVKKL